MISPQSFAMRLEFVFILILFSSSVVSDIFNSMDCSMPGFLVLHCLPELAQTHVHWVGDAILSSVVPFSCLRSLPVSGSFPMGRFFPSDAQSIGRSASAMDLPMNIQAWFPLGLTGLISLHPRDFQESSPTPQFKSINSPVLGFFYSPTLTFIHDYWKNHSFD